MPTCEGKDGEEKPVIKRSGKQIGEASEQRRRKIVEQAIASYYDRLSLQAQNEEVEWGNFSLTQIMNEAD
jgi:hypothetical protein